MNQDYKNIIKSLVDIILLPPFAKFIFSLSDQIKDTILDLIYSYLNNNSNNMLSGQISNLIEEKLISFLKSNYSNSSNRSESKINKSKILI